MGAPWGRVDRERVPVLPAGVSPPWAQGPPSAPAEQRPGGSHPPGLSLAEAHAPWTRDCDAVLVPGPQPGAEESAALAWEEPSVACAWGQSLGRYLGPLRGLSALQSRGSHCHIRAWSLAGLEPNGNAGPLFPKR